jgi:hypothetical protein
MSIRYSLRPFALGNAEGKYLAQLQLGESVETEELVDQIVARGSTVGRADALAVLELIDELVLTNLAQNRPVFIGRSLRVSPGIEGLFDGPQAPWDPERNEIVARAEARRWLADQLALLAHPERVAAEELRPVLSSFFDIISDLTNEVITPSGTALLTGEDLGYDPAHADEGFYLVETDGTAVVKLPAPVRLKPKEAILKLPASGVLPAGRWQLELRRRFTEAGDLRTGQLPALLQRT